MIGITVRSDVSLGRRILHPELSPAENQQIYGTDYSPAGMGHNLSFLASISGELDARTGLLMRHDSLQALFKSVTHLLDHQLLNDSVEEFKTSVPTLENIGHYVWQRFVRSLPEHLHLRRLRVEQGEKTWVDLSGEPSVRLTQEWQIHCVHRHHNPKLTMAENQELYHKCAAVHGHEYRVQVTIENPVDERTGLAIAKSRFSHIVEKHLIQPFDGQFLNDLIGNTSGEIIAARFTEILKPVLPELLTVSLRETRKNSFYAVPNGQLEAAIHSLF